MTSHIAPAGLSLLTGAVVAAQDFPALEVADRVGVAGIAVAVVWWMLGSFSRRLDRLTDSIDRLSGHAEKKE